MTASKNQTLMRIGIIILLILFVLYLGSSSHISQPTKSQEAEAEITALLMVASNYKTDYGTYPSSDSKLFYEQISGKNKLNQSYVNDIHLRLSNSGSIIDPWGYSYDIKEEDGQISIISPGLENCNKMPWYRRELGQ